MNNGKDKRNVTQDRFSRRTLMKRAAKLTGGSAIYGLLSPMSGEAFAASPAPAARLEVSETGVVASASNAIVETTAGKIRGYTGNGIYTFKGVPYAAPTGGSARFMPPAKPKPWTGIRSSMAFGPVCPQISWVDWNNDEVLWVWEPDFGHPDEDCLRANIWTPGINDSKKRPVMVWLHTGGFSSGSSSELKAYDGENLSRRGDVVVVSLNYRIGVLGHLNLADYGKKYASSANAGMLDLVAALEWVRDNIANFGGDPGNVTIFGQSGGSIHVATLMAMPAAKGLFHKAIMQSGFVTWRSPKLSGRQAAGVLEELGLKGSQINQIQALPVERLINAGEAALRELAAITQDPAEQVSWAPTVDGGILPEYPFDSVAPTVSAHVPLLIGNVGNESGMQVPGHPERESLTYEELAKKAAAKYGDKSGRIVEAYRRAHPNAKPVVLWELIIGPRSLSIAKAERKAALGAAPVYVYWFTWQSPVLDGRMRAFHTCDFAFAFDNTDKCSHMTGGGPDARELAGKVSDAWISFARNGDPNNRGLPKWPAFTPERGETMIFDNECEVKNDPDREERRILEATSRWDVRKAMPRF